MKKIHDLWKMLYGMLLFVLLAVFIAGLMIGRTPEYLGKKIEAFEMKMVALVILVTPMLVLLGAAVISGLVGEVTDTLVILVIVVLNAVIGFVQAWRADQAMAALRLLAAAQCRSSPPQSWCPATSCCWRRATRSRPTCG